MTTTTHRTAAALLVVSMIGLLAGWQADAQTIRADEAREAREQKGRDPAPHRRSSVDRFLFKLEDDLLLERLFGPPRGIYVRLGGIGEGAGFGAGPALGYNTPTYHFTASAAGTMKKYFIADTSLRFPGTLGHNDYIRSNGPYLEVDGRRRDFPEEDFFGLGPGSQVSQRSNFALRDTLARITGGVERRSLKTGIGLAYLHVSAGAGADTQMPSATEVFDQAELPGIGQPLSYLVVEPFFEFSTIDRAINDRSGGVYRVSVTRHQDGTLSRYSFHRWQADLRQYINFVKGTRSLAFRAWASAADAAGGNAVPFYLMPTLGGAQTLRGYRTFRFRDRSALLLQAEYRWRINEFVSGALFYDTGAVARRLNDVGRLERDYGVGLRVGGRMRSAFRFDVAFGGREGRRYLLRFDDAF